MTTPEPSLRVQLATVIAVVMEIDDCADTAERVDAAKLALDALLGEVATWLRSDEVHALMLAHLRHRIQDCSCGWDELGKSHSRHVAAVLADRLEGR